ncbi:MAG: helicase [Calditrichaeota bacterium]|nr:MAG: helicase [Calditrichota bacterium]
MHFVVFDLETKQSFDEVGGFKNAHKLGISVGVVYDSESDKTTAYRENEMDDLVEQLQSADLVIGFNNFGFDNIVLQPYTIVTLDALPGLDLMQKLQQALGHRVSLDNVAKGTLNSEKSGGGLQAIEWYRKGEWDKLISYCEQDVLITRDIYLFGKENGYVQFYDQFKRAVRKVDVQW